MCIGSLATRLLVLVLIPIISLSVLGFQRIESENAAAARAEGVADIVALQQTVAAAIPPAQLERIALEGLARIDELGLPRDIVVGWAGVDFEQTYEANRVDLERALDDLGARYGSLRLLDGSSLSARLGFVRGALATERLASDEMRAVSSDVDRVFESLDAVLEEALVTGRLHEIDTRMIDGDRNQLDALATALVSAGTHANTVVRGIIFRTDETISEISATEAVHQATLDAFAATLDFEERRELDAIRALLAPLPADLEEVADDANPITSDEDVIKLSADAVVGQMDYLAALENYSTEFHGGVASRALVIAEDARTDASRIRSLLWVSGATTLALILFLMWSTLLPIRRLTRRAEKVSRGDLAPDPLPIRGPRDIRGLTKTMNEMLSTLHRVDQEVSHLASGDLSENLAPDLPGAIGVSVRESVRHLSEVTSRLHTSEQLSSAIVAQAADAIWTLRDDDTIKTANEASARLTGVAIADQLGRPIHDFLSRETGEARVTSAPGGRTKVLVARSAIEVGSERVIAVIAHDISERSRFEERLAYQASHDSLTGLPNRFAVLEHLDELAVQGQHEVAVLFVDLDAFKSVNDTRGHSAGDMVLVEVASRIAGCVRDDEFVGRLGGDEFVVVVHEFVQIADVVALGHRIIREIELPHSDDQQIFALSASVGIARSSPTASTLDTIRDADSAVYQAKRRGRGRVEVFDASLQDDLDRLADLELALRHAIRNEELVVHLQPIVNLDMGHIGGAEALVRWARPGHGLVPPNDFIPVAERSGLIFELERWVLTRVCEHLAEWRRRDPGCSYRVAVNVSGRHLIEGDLLADIDAALSLTGADPTMLELELTETHLLADPEQVTEVLEELRRRGVTIAIDDFGTGYSSMTYLQHLPVDVIKIDRSFVAHATEDGYDSTVIEAMLSIGRTLHLQVVAEGVETSAQLDYVRARGCDRAQGFLLARPMPVEEAELILFESPAVTLT